MTLPLDVMAGPAVAARRHRLLAMLIDGVLLFLLNLVLIALLEPGLFGGSAAGADSDSSGGSLALFFGNPFHDPYWFTDLLLSVIAALYFWGTHVRWGRTLGKKLCGIKVVSLDGGPLTSRQAGVRAASYSVVVMVPYIGLALALADQLWIVGPGKRCLHDLLAGTVVIQD
ncbi:hypothetical protein Skr01_13640 [Sphaerisporangium krabiense]|uniref:Putative RDD family membrane protein YckC n=1 Tax=Sphaerisporangium krabiense TaxID=763782 RepID=A0A7W9DNZ6_9ACTN|nr:RDD family protein [Sphaerisporangium krabiense]MBB5624760.1 putative RDD family membrane protein YckC [Sphaerisporangium krabiense]GII61279.1 hypothetical protein Skr01_13640 [Sphaerisporangium krabiense]